MFIDKRFTEGAMALLLLTTILESLRYQGQTGVFFKDSLDDRTRTSPNTAF